jgi:hypothetical protein
MPFMTKHVVHISEAEAASNSADVLARVRAGIEVVIGDEVRPVSGSHASGGPIFKGSDTVNNE